MGSSPSSLSVSATNINDITTSISEKTCTGNTSTTKVKNVSVGLENINCGNITVISQSAKLNCESDYNAAVAQTAKNLLAAAKKDEVPSLAIPPNLPTKGNTKVKEITDNTVTTYINALCGNDNLSEDLVSNVTLDANGVQCNTLKLFSQKASVNILCAQNVLQQVADYNNVGAAVSSSSWWTNLTSSIYGVIILGIVLLLIVFLVAYFLFKHRSHVQTLQQVKKYGGARTDLPSSSGSPQQ